MAIVAGNTVYWTSGGVTLQGVVLSTPTLHSDGSPNQDGGEPVYHINTVTGPGTSLSASTKVVVRQAEVRASA